MQTGARDLRSLLDGGRRFEIEHAVSIIIACCKAYPSADPLGGISPTRILINNGDVELAAPDFSRLEVGYVAPEVGRGGQVRHISAGERHGSFVVQHPVEFDRACAAVFALGCVLWELLAGRPLFKGTTDYGTLELTRAANAPPLPSTPAELEAIVRTALAKDVADRYPTPSELAEALAGYLARSAQPRD
jgi:serine/threonine protein kinase